MHNAMSLCFILKDEAATIVDVIKSFWFNGKPLYDELIVGIDNSTTDETPQIVSHYTNRMFYFDWDNDFSKARNLVIESCRHDWVFMPDGHEFLTSDSIVPLQALLETDNRHLRMVAPYIGMFEGRKCCLQACGPSEFPSYIFPRPILFVNTPDIRFESSVHNYLVDKTGNHYKLCHDIRLEHRQSRVRFEQRKQQRFDMNLPVFTQRVRDNPSDERDAFYLAVTKSEFASTDELLIEYRKAIEKSSNTDQKSQLCILLGTTLCQLAEKNRDVALFREVRNIVLPMLDEAWSKGEGYFLLAWAAYGLGKYEEAIHWAEVVTDVIDMKYPLTSFFISPESYTTYPLDIIASSKKALGDLVGARNAAMEILRWKPNCKTAQQYVKDLEMALLEAPTCEAV